MKLTLKKIITASVLSLAMGGVAQADVWVGPATGGEFSTVSNWN